MKSIFEVFFDIATHGQIRLRFHNDTKKNWDHSFLIGSLSIKLKKLSNLQERENAWKSCLTYNKIKRQIAIFYESDMHLDAI